MRTRTLWIVAAVAACVVVGGLAASGVFTRSEPAVDAAAQPQASATLPCEEDARCVGSRHVAAAALACKPGVEDLARDRVRWSDESAATPRFARFAWRDRAQGTITFIGDQAEFENGAGAFQPVTYECDFDPAQGKALAVRVQQGRLPR